MEENRLRVFNNMVLRKIFESMRDEVTGEWRKLRNEELCEVNSSSEYFSSDKIQENEMGGTCSTYEGKESYVLGFGGES